MEARRSVFNGGLLRLAIVLEPLARRNWGDKHYLNIPRMGDTPLLSWGSRVRDSASEAKDGVTISQAPSCHYGRDCRDTRDARPRLARSEHKREARGRLVPQAGKVLVDKSLAMP